MGSILYGGLSRDSRDYILVVSSLPCSPSLHVSLSVPNPNAQESSTPKVSFNN